MSKKVTVFISVLLAFTMVFLIVGCGGSGSTGGGTPSTGGGGTPAPSGGGGSTPAPSGGGAAPAGPARSKTVSIGGAERVRSIDPGLGYDMGTMYALYFTYDTLIINRNTVEGDGTEPSEYIPWLAERYEIAPDNMSWTFWLRQDVYFHNGQHFTADDVVATFQRLIDRRDELQVAITYWQQLDSVEKIDEYTVKVGFNVPFPWAAASLVFTYIIPHEAYEEMGDDLWNKQLCYGTGPWMMEEWVDGQYVHYKKNPNYWNKDFFDSYFEDVYYRFIAEPATGVAAMLSGDLDVLFGPSGVDTRLLPQFAGTEDRIELIKRETKYFDYLQFNCSPDSAFGDINLRKAMSLALDRQLIVDGIFGGEGYVSDGGLFSFGVEGYDPSIGKLPYDPELAKKLIAESNYNGEPLEIICPISSPKAEEVVLAVADMANAVGFNIVPITEEMGVYQEKRNTGNFAAFVGNTMIAVDPGSAKRHLTLMTTDVYNHRMGLNPNLDFEYLRSLIATFDSAANYTISGDAALKINNFMNDYAAPMIELFGMNATNVQVRGLTGVKYYLSGSFNFVYMDWDPSRLN